MDYSQSRSATLTRTAMGSNTVRGSLSSTTCKAAPSDASTSLDVVPSRLSHLSTASKIIQQWPWVACVRRAYGKQYY